MRSSASLRASLERLPSDFEVLRGERGVLAVRSGYRAALERARFGPDDVLALEPSELAGRIPLLELAAGEERLLVRRFRHGGMLRWMSGERFGDPARPFEELRLAAELGAHGVPTPLAIAARAQQMLGGGWRLALVTRRVEDALDAERVLRRLQRDGGSDARIAELFTAVGAFVGRLHRLGFVHTDLTPRNVLVGEEVLEPDGVPSTPRLWLLDLDRCRFESSLSSAERARVLARLLRYVVRREAESRSVLSRGRVARFLRAYCGALTAEGTAAGSLAWREEWRRVERLSRQGVLLHRAGWVLEELFGASPERGRRPE